MRRYEEIRVRYEKSTYFWDAISGKFYRGIAMWAKRKTGYIQSIATVAATMFDGVQKKGDYTHGVSKNVLAQRIHCISRRRKKRGIGRFSSERVGKIFSGNFLRCFFSFLFFFIAIKFKFRDPRIIASLLRIHSIQLRNSFLSRFV